MDTTMNESVYFTNKKTKDSPIFKPVARKNQLIFNNKARISVLCISIIVMLLIVCSGLIIANAAVSDDTISDQNKYYTSISIEKGDTLWSIASNYVSGPKTISNYVNELKEINNLQTDCIYQGQNLIVYYYSSEQKWTPYFSIW